MEKDIFISFNIIKTDGENMIILNYNKEPLVFHSFEDNVQEFLTQNTDFISYLEKSNVFNVDNYDKVKIVGIYFDHSNDDKISKIEYDIQDLFLLKNLNFTALSDEIIYNSIYKTYLRVIKKQNKENKNFDTYKDIHNEIVKLCPTTEINTIINYYINVINNTYNINNDNLNYLIERIKKSLLFI